MYEQSYSLFQLAGISFFVFLFGLSVGVQLGSMLQRRDDAKRRILDR